MTPEKIAANGDTWGCLNNNQQSTERKPWPLPVNLSFGSLFTINVFLRMALGLDPLGNIALEHCEHFQWAKVIISGVVFCEYF
jgi:hypothetical protein